jgi:hypothetical protein
VIRDPGLLLTVLEGGKSRIGLFILILSTLAGSRSGTGSIRGGVVVMATANPELRREVIAIYKGISSHSSLLSQFLPPVS